MTRLTPSYLLPDARLEAIKSYEMFEHHSVLAERCLQLFLKTPSEGRLHLIRRAYLSSLQNTHREQAKKYYARYIYLTR